MKVKLSQAFDLRMGKTPSRNIAEYWGGDHKWVSIADIGNAGKYISETKECITDDGVSGSGIKVVPKGTVIMSFKLSIGKTTITSEDMYTNEAIMAFLDKGIYPVDPNYLYYLCCGTDWTAGTNKAVMGMTLNKATLSEKMIDLPSVEEQKDIVEKLDAVDSLINNQKRQLAKLDELVKSQFVEMFGDPAINPMSWTKTKLVECCIDDDDIKCGPFGTQLKKEEYTKEGVPVWGIPHINSNFVKQPEEHVTQDKAQQLSSYSVCSGDLVMSRKGNVGACALYPENFKPGIIHSDVIRIRVDAERVDPIFMMHQLHISQDVQWQIEQVSNGAVMAGINVTKLKNIKVLLPDFDLQRLFMTFVRQADKSKLAVKQSLEKLEMLKKSLLQQYFG